jgi:uncharacterized protein YbjT (DUF2867 family)
MDFRPHTLLRGWQWNRWGSVLCFLYLCDASATAHSARGCSADDTGDRPRRGEYVVRHCTVRHRYCRNHSRRLRHKAADDSCGKVSVGGIIGLSRIPTGDLRMQCSLKQCSRYGKAGERGRNATMATVLAGVDGMEPHPDSYCVGFNRTVQRCRFLHGARNETGRGTVKQNLVTGSTGKVGSTVMEWLLRAGEKVRAASRNPESNKTPPGAETVRFDYAIPSTFAPALEGVERVFLMEPQPSLGPADTVMLPFAKTVIERGCKIVLLSSASVGCQQEPLSRVEETVKQAERHVILRPNWFMDNFHTWWVEPIKYERVLPLPAGDAHSPFIDARDVGAAAAMALRSDTADGKTFTLTGPESLSYAESAAVIGQAIGTEVHYVPIDDESFVRTLLEAGLPQALADYVMGLFRLTRSRVMEGINNDVELLTGKKPHSLREYAELHRGVWL